MDIKMVDVTIHIDETLDEAGREKIVEHIRQQRGVISVALHKEKQHLMLIEYNPDQNSSASILEAVKKTGVHAELVGL